MKFELGDHQIQTRDFINEHPRTLVFSDAGTGKTAGVLAGIEQLRKRGGFRRALVFAPKAILESSWVDDARTFTPNLSVAVATANNRRQAFELGTAIVVTNHDAARWVAENQDVLEGFDILVLDESTAYKHRNSQRSKSIAKIKDRFKVRIAMTGTPMSNGLLDLWHQAYVIDDGEHIGPRFFAFRHTTHEPRPVGFQNLVEWIEKPGAREVVADLLSDITIRHKFEDCVDIPKHHMYPENYTMPAKLRKHYDRMAKDALLELDKVAGEVGKISAVHEAAVRTKLLQIASGAVYDGTGEYRLLDESRYDMVAQLVVERDHPSIVAFQWKHQRDGLIKALERAGVSEYMVLDGATKDVGNLVRGFQKGAYKAGVIHPQTGSHGLTLTAAKTTIWASPPAMRDAERFAQFNRRIYRKGQDSKTETILIQARDTIEPNEYAMVDDKVEAQDNLLLLLQSFYQASAGA